MMSKVTLKDRYELEKSLATRLLTSSKAERTGLYSEVYREYYAKFGQHALANSPEHVDHNGNRLKMKLLRPFLRKSTVVLEVGGGDMALTSAIARYAGKVISVEAFEGEHDRKMKENVDVLIRDTPPYPITDGSVDVAFSSHFVEHLHPDDLIEHLKEVSRLLKKGGSYICITPNILYGPHDISGAFNHTVSCGLHLREYSYQSLTQIFRSQNFSRISSMVRLNGRPRALYLQLKLLAEFFLRHIPREWLFKISDLEAMKVVKPFRPLEQVLLVARK